ncbi:MAG: DoxX family protein [Pyrinomonadaceae bacterium]|nr:DoxX family protein [Pyrinomonadaceae bacterium]
MLKKILFGGEANLSAPANIGLSLLRIFAGIALAFGHGIGKVPPSEGFIKAVGKMGFPMPGFFAWAAGISEFFGAIFLALGLFTRLSSFFVGFTMFVGLVGVHLNDPFEKQEKAFLYLFIALLFLFKGASDWSIDSFIRGDGGE